MKSNVISTFFIKSPLVLKWIFLLSFLLSFYTPLKADILTIDQRIERINQIYERQQKEKITLIIGQVDKAIDSVVKLPDKERKKYAVLISLAARKYEIDPRIMIAILRVESDFRQNAVSHTGDYSVAQINYDVWKKAFVRMDRHPLNKTRLVKDEAYAIFRMAEILSIYKAQHAKTDSIWFARYHSSTISKDATKSYKIIYKNKLAKEFKKLLNFGPNMLLGLPANPQLVAEAYLGKEKLKGF